MASAVMTDDDAYEVHRDARRPHRTRVYPPPAPRPPVRFWPVLCAMCADTGFETGTTIRCRCQELGL
jgi:hypothetical protein